MWYNVRVVEKQEQIKTFVFNGWAATSEMWSRCTFRHDRIFSYLEHLSGESLKAVEREEAVILVGFSMGGSFVQEAILKFPEKIRGVVFVSSTPKMMEAKDEGWAGMSLHRRKALKLGTQMMNPGNPLPEFAESNLDAGLDFLGKSDHRAALEEIAGKTRFPVAIFQSKRDGIVRPHNAEFLNRIFPQTSLTWVEGTDHDLPAKIPELISSAVKGVQRCAVKLPRGLIEVSNICQKNCLYCGIRRDAAKLPRYHLTEAEVLECADEAVRRGFPAIALQAGEIESEANTVFYENVLRKLPAGLEVTLSLGEQTEEVCRRWKAAAGDRVLRYLLRIETSNRELYAKIHPADHSFDRRLECIRTLKRLGYVTGSGVMIGLPGQTREDLERDLDWFVEEKLDMVGMGPFVPSANTPMGSVEVGEWSEKLRMETALWMIRETRRRMPEINIVAATALEVLDPEGRAKGFANGANVYMPNLTPSRYRINYDLYPGKSSAVISNL